MPFLSPIAGYGVSLPGVDFSLNTALEAPLSPPVPPHSEAIVRHDLPGATREQMLLPALDRQAFRLPGVMGREIKEPQEADPIRAPGGHKVPEPQLAPGLVNQRYFASATLNTLKLQEYAQEYKRSAERARKVYQRLTDIYEKGEVYGLREVWAMMEALGHVREIFAIPEEGGLTDFELEAKRKIRAAAEKRGHLERLVQMERFGHQLIYLNHALHAIRAAQSGNIIRMNHELNVMEREVHQDSSLVDAPFLERVGRDIRHQAPELNWRETSHPFLMGAIRGLGYKTIPPDKAAERAGKLRREIFNKRMAIAQMFLQPGVGSVLLDDTEALGKIDILVRLVFDVREAEKELTRLGYPSAPTLSLEEYETFVGRATTKPEKAYLDCLLQCGEDLAYLAEIEDPANVQRIELLLPKVKEAAEKLGLEVLNDFIVKILEQAINRYLEEAKQAAHARQKEVIDTIFVELVPPLLSLFDRVGRDTTASQKLFLEMADKAYLVFYKAVYQEELERAADFAKRGDATNMERHIYSALQATRRQAPKEGEEFWFQSDEEQIHQLRRVCHQKEHDEALVQAKVAIGSFLRELYIERARKAAQKGGFAPDEKRIKEIEASAKKPTKK